jgi:gliding motility-associated-like protein
MKKALSFLLLLSCSWLMAQNLVPNYDFEDTLQCPNAFGQIAIADGWFSPTDGTPDYFNSCVAGNSTLGNPDNYYGSQAPYSGNGYAGFFAFGPGNLREYVSIPLTNNLQVGEQYCVSFKVSHAEFTYNAVENIGLYFSTNPISVTNGSQHLGITPQIVNSNGILSNDNEWVTISGTFTATDTMRYITIGNFYSNNDTNEDITFEPTPGVTGGFINSAYYYLDDVVVVELPTVNTISITNNNNSPLLCEGNNIDLSVEAGALSYNWTTTADPFTSIGTENTLNVSPLVSTSYIMTASFGECVLRDTLAVFVYPQPTVSFTHGDACVGSVVNFFANSSNTSPTVTFAWDFDNDGSTDATTAGGASHTYSTPGTYTVTLEVANDAVCVSTFSSTITVAAECDVCTQNNNLVANSSAEAYTACPDSLNHLSLTNWSQATEGSVDYFNACATGDNGVANNIFGSQAAASGNAYLGIMAYAPFNYREYAQAQMTQPLEVGKSYCVSFKVSLGDNSRKAIDQLGAYFSTDPLNVATQSALNLTPQVSNDAGNLLTDKNGWTTISGNFTATQAFQYITLGNFYENGATATTDVSGSTPNFAFHAYYYLDDVSVIELPTLNISDDATVCVGTEVNLTASDTNSFCTLSWTDENGVELGTNAQLTVNQMVGGTHTYYLTASLNSGCAVSQAVTVTWLDIPIANLLVAPSCAGGITVFQNLSQGSVGANTYAWDFENDNSVDFLSATATDQFHIYPAPGTYIALLIVRNVLGCSDSLYLPVVIAATCDPCNSGNNSVVNGDFEAISDCPTALDQADLVSSWLYGGESPNGTPDIFASCSGNSVVGVPNNVYGSQAAYSGNNYIGFSPINPADVTQKQYIVGQTLPLTVGQTYCVRAYIALADSSAFSTDQLGIALGVDGITANQMPLWNNPENVQLAQTSNWTEFSATFVADSAYSFIGIGDFGQYTSNVVEQNAANPLALPYYYIDAVSIVPLTISVSADATICEGESTELSATTNTCESYWSIAGFNQLLSTSTTLTVSPTTTTTYVFTGSNGSCSISDTVTVFVNPIPQISLSDTLSFCSGGAVTLDATVSVNDATVIWTPALNITNPNILTPNVFPTQSTWYYLSVTNNQTGCVNTDSVLVVVNPLPNTDITTSLTICEGSGVQLYASGGLAYSWNDDPTLSTTNVADPIATPTQNTTYTVTITNAVGCQSTESVTVNVRPAYLSEPETLVLCGNVSAVLQPDVPATAVSFSWSPTTDLSNPNVKNPTTFTPNDVVYTLSYVDDLGCSGMAQVVVDANPAPSAGLDVSICSGGTAQLIASSGASSYSWSPATGLSDSSIANPIATPSETTNYVLTTTYSTSTGNCVLSDTVTVFVNSTGFAQAGNDVVICSGSEIQLNALGGDSYSWSPATGLSDATVANPIANPSETTEYIVTVQNNTTGCVSNDTVLVTVETASAPEFTATLDPICTMPLEATTICLPLNYSGCEPLFTSVGGQLSAFSSGFVYSNGSVCFDYYTTFYGNDQTIRTDTLFITTCTQFTNQCIESTVVLRYCDTAPEWGIDNIDAITCQNNLVQIGLPRPTDLDADETNLTYSTTSPGNGTAVYINGAVSYTPNSGFSGTDQFTVVVCDELYPVQCDSMNVSVTVSANTAPTTPTVNVTTPNQTAVDFCLPVSDAESGVTTTVTSIPNVGTFTPALQGGNCFVFTPNGNYSGTQAFSYSSCDACGLCSEGTVNITVQAPINYPPIITPNNIIISTPYQTPVTTCLTISDPNGDPFTSTITFEPLNGTYNIDTNNCITYTPNAGFNGNDAISILVCDEFGACNSVTVVVVVSPPNLVDPTVLDVTVSTEYETGVTVCINASDPQNDDLAYTFGNPSNGSISISDSCIFYTPNNGFSGLDTVVVTVCDSENHCANANIYITVGSPNNTAPIGQDLSLTTVPNGTVSDCISFTNEPAGENVTVVVGNDDVTHGTLTMQPNGCFTYTANGDYSGADNFTALICDAGGLCDVVTVNITIVNPSPIANNLTISTVVNTSTNNCVTYSNAPTGEDVTVSVLNAPINGSTAMTPNGCFTYTPNNNFVGNDSFTALVCDVASLCDTATINVIVTANNPAPTITGQNVNTLNHTPVNGCLSFSNEPAGETTTITLIGAASNGTATLGTDGCFTYVPTGTFTGTDQFVAQICDALNQCDTAIVNITVGPNTPPIFDPIPLTPMIAGQDTIVCLPSFFDGQGDFCSITAINSYGITTGGPPDLVGTAEIVSPNCIHYTSVAGFSGSININVSVCDDQVPPSCVVTDIAFGIYNIPTVQNVTVSTPQAETVLGCFTIVDLDPGDNHTVTIVGSPSNGAATIGDNNCINYTPNSSFIGIDEVTVQFCDTHGLCTTAVLTIIVTDNLIAENDTIATEESIPVNIDTHDNDTSPNNFTVTIIDQPNHGTATVDANTGVITYTAIDYAGSDTLTYTLCNTPLGCDTAVVVITVTNNLVAFDDYTNTNQDTGVDIIVLDNDVEPGTITPQAITTPTNGQIFNTPGGFTYLPDADFIGTDSFMYVISYPGYGSDTAVVYITVAGPPASPIANDDILVTPFNTSGSVNIETNDLIPQGSYVINITQQPQHGTISYDAATGIVTYTPTTGYSGNDSFTYTICHSVQTNLCDDATVTITVQPEVIVDCNIKVYKLVTPNNDNKNDQLTIGGLDCGGNDVNTLVIFNRWGNPVFETDNYNNTSNFWDGTYKGNAVPAGTYFYILKVPANDFEEQGYIEVTQ